MARNSLESFQMVRNGLGGFQTSFSKSRSNSIYISSSKGSPIKLARLNHPFKEGHRVKQLARRRLTAQRKHIQQRNTSSTRRSSKSCQIQPCPRAVSTYLQASLPLLEECRAKIRKLVAGFPTCIGGISLEFKCMKILLGGRFAFGDVVRHLCRHTTARRQRKDKARV